MSSTTTTPVVFSGWAVHSLVIEELVTCYSLETAYIYTRRTNYQIWVMQHSDYICMTNVGDNYHEGCSMLGYLMCMNVSDIISSVDGMARMPASRNTFSRPPNSQTKRF